MIDANPPHSDRSARVDPTANAEPAAPSPVRESPPTPPAIATAMTDIPSASPASPSRSAPTRKTRPASPILIRVKSESLGFKGFELTRRQVGWIASGVFHAVVLAALLVWVVPRSEEEFAKFRGSMGEGARDAFAFERYVGLDDPLLPPEPLQMDRIDTAIPQVRMTDDILTLDGPGGRVSGDSDLDGGQFGQTLFGGGVETVRGVAVRVGDPQFTLIWNTRVDIDLHVEEPGGSRIYWRDRRGAKGGELDVDNTSGFGPENIYWNDPQNPDRRGDGPPGEYVWRVHYYGAPGGLAVPTRWQVRVKHDGRVRVYSGTLRRPGEWSKAHKLLVDRPGSSSGPTTNR